MLAPWRFQDARIEVVVPPLAALLPDAAGEAARDGAPLLGAELTD